MRKLLGFLLLVGVFLTLSGCGKANVIGTWTARLTKDKPEAAGIDAALDKLTTMSLEFRNDGTCAMTILVEIPGTYEVAGNRVTMTFPTHDSIGMSSKNNKPLVLDLSSDGNSLVAERDSTSSGDLVFVKQTS
jgi:hypothetical protein